MTYDFLDLPSNPLTLLRKILGDLEWMVEKGAEKQEPARKGLVKRLLRVCSNCEKAYGKFLGYITKIEEGYTDPPKLLKEIRKVSKDPAYRQTWKPDKLCGEIDVILAESHSWLNSLRWSVAVTRIGKLRRQLKQFQGYDLAFYQVFDAYALELSDLANRLDDAIKQKKPTKRIVGSIRSRTTRVKTDVSKTLKTVQRVRTAVSI